MNQVRGIHWGRLLSQGGGTSREQSPDTQKTDLYKIHPMLQKAVLLGSLIHLPPPPRPLQLGVINMSA